jgi:hypothetical protein
VGGVITGSSASLTGAVTAASTVGGVITGSSASVTGAVTGASLAGTITTASQTNITAVGTLGSLSVTGNVQGGNLRTAGLISATGTVTASQFNGSGAGLTSIPGANVSGAVPSATSATSATTAGTVTSAAQSAITSVGTLTGLTINNATTAITNGAANGSGNIGASGATFNTIFAKATSAQYADLAEMYTADAEYAPGTVVSFGGDQEITVSAQESDTRVAGVVSTNPSYIMNSALEGEHVAAVALTGRVPTRVVGAVAKGDLMVSAGNGAAKADNNARNGAVIGKALENFDGAAGTIEVVVGRF